MNANRILVASFAAVLSITFQTFSAPVTPWMQFEAETPAEARAWQESAREKLFALMMGGSRPERVPLQTQVLRRLEVPKDGSILEEVTVQSLPDRRAHLWLARPLHPKGKVGGMLAIHGHGGSGEQIVRGTGLYWYGREFIRRGYVVVAPDVGQHTLQHTNWTLMGERTWDSIRALDLLATLPEVDPERLAVAGLSLGGETTMYVAALEPRVGIACSSGWLTTVANMKNGHCPCFDFPGLQENFDFSDIFACVAPRQLTCELGLQERAPGGFPVSIGREAFEKVRAAYKVFGAETNLTLTVHPGPHVFVGTDFLPRLCQTLGTERRAVPDDASALAWHRFTKDAPEALDGVPYYWLGRGDLEITFEARPAPGDALEFLWGAKGDERSALIRVNGRSLSIQEGGHWGFRWVRVAVPEGTTGEAYKIELKRGDGAAAFLSEVRLVSAKAATTAPDLRQPSYRAKVLLSESSNTNAETAFPEMRALWTNATPVPEALQADETVSTAFAKAELNGRLANEAFFRCRRFIDGWLAHADPATGLIPRNLRESRDFWNGRDSAADNYPFMVLSAAMTDRGLFEGRMLEMLRTETKLTSRVGRLPDDYSFSKQGWRREQEDLEAIIFDGAEYVKDGLLPITEWLGSSPWSERMLGILDDIWQQARISTPFGAVPTLNLEVSGDLLQACSRAYWFTGERKYLEWGIRLGDYYLLGTNHPTRDLKQLRLVDHGCEVINGLSELYVAVSQTMSAKRLQYRKPLHELFATVLEKGRNNHGLLYTWFNPQTGEHSKDLCDTWGYDYDGVYTLWLKDGTPAFRSAVREVLGNLRGNYVGACWAEKSADAYADSIEGAINLVNREPVESAMEWIDSQTQLMWTIQQPDGIIEGWHGDGNFARTSLMYALWKTQGVTARPWRKDLRFGAVFDEGTLRLSVTASEPWQGRLIFDRMRHRDFMKLPLDYPRINQFPEWFTVETDAEYGVRVGTDRKAKDYTGADLMEGLPVDLKQGETIWMTVRLSGGA